MIGLRLDLHYYMGIVCRNLVIIEYPINFANEINKLLDNFVILNPFHMFTRFLVISRGAGGFQMLIEKNSVKSVKF